MLDYLRIMLDARLAKMDERGASAVEYGLLIAGIAALIVVVVFAFGGVIKNIFQTHLQQRWQERRRQLLIELFSASMAADLRVRGHRAFRPSAVATGPAPRPDARLDAAATATASPSVTTDLVHTGHDRRAFA